MALSIIRDFPGHEPGHEQPGPAPPAAAPAPPHPPTGLPVVLRYIGSSDCTRTAAAMTWTRAPPRGPPRWAGLLKEEDVVLSESDPRTSRHQDP